MSQIPSDNLFSQNNWQFILNQKEMLDAQRKIEAQRKESPAQTKTYKADSKFLQLLNTKANNSPQYQNTSKTPSSLEHTPNGTDFAHKLERESEKRLKKALWQAYSFTWIRSNSMINDGEHKKSFAEQMYHDKQMSNIMAEAFMSVEK